MTRNNLVSQNHQGGIKGRSSLNTVTELFHKLSKNTNYNRTKALITLDQSIAYNIVCHKILKSKLLHIGIHNDSVNMVMDYLNSR